jgi:hypothetical protein
MKKSLFATTAIVAAFGFGSTAAQAQDASLSLSAFSEFYANYTNQDVPPGNFSDEAYDFSTNTEFEVNGEVTLDNGIAAGMSIEVEADEGQTQTVDENLIYLDGSFGRVEFGNEDGAHDTMYYGATSVKAVYPGTYNNTTGAIINYGQGGAAVTPKLGDTGEDTKITYYTPRFSGFQVGLTWAADDNTSAIIPSRNANPVTEQIEFGTNYVNSFNGFDLAASFTGYWGNADKRPMGADENPYNVAGGLVIGFGGFELGGSVGFGENTLEDEFQVYDLGVGYSTGPWSVSLTGIYSHFDQNATNLEDELTEANVGVNYALGQGVSVFASAAVGEQDNETVADNDYVSVLSGVGVSF